MANIKSAVKRAKQNPKRRMHNKALRSRLRTFIKEVRSAIESKDKAVAQQKFIAATSVIDKSAQKQIIKKNAASRYKSRLSAAVKAMA